MRTRVSFLALIAAAAAVAALASPASAATRTCGYVVHHRYQVKVHRGRVSCKEARKALVTVIRGEGKRYGDPNKGIEGSGWAVPGGWRCSRGDGGTWGCARGRSGGRARDWVSAEQRVSNRSRLASAGESQAGDAGGVRLLDRARRG